MAGQYNGGILHTASRRWWQHTLILWREKGARDLRLPERLATVICKRAAGEY
jgi:hypothetical protein